MDGSNNVHFCRRKELKEGRARWRTKMRLVGWLAGGVDGVE